MSDMATVSSKYQIVIPREIRDLFGIRPGYKVVFIPYKKTLRMVIVPPIQQARGRFPTVNSEGMREEEDELR